jgi:hypothetical protein
LLTKVGSELLLLFWNGTCLVLMMGGGMCQVIMRTLQLFCVRILGAWGQISWEFTLEAAQAVEADWLF